MRTLDIIDTKFLRASSLIWTSRARTRERASGRRELSSLALLLPAPHFRVSSRASTFHDISQMESFLAG